jgi:hypothetical protein
MPSLAYITYLVPEDIIVLHPIAFDSLDSTGWSTATWDIERQHTDPYEASLAERAAWECELDDAPLP